MTQVNCNAERQRKQAKGLNVINEGMKHTLTLKTPPKLDKQLKIAIIYGIINVYRQSLMSRHVTNCLKEYGGDYTLFENYDDPLCGVVWNV